MTSDQSLFPHILFCCSFGLVWMCRKLKRLELQKEEQILVIEVVEWDIPRLLFVPQDQTKIVDVGSQNRQLSA